MDASKFLRVSTLTILAAMAIACTDPSAGAEASGGVPPGSSEPGTSIDPAESGAPAGPDDYEY